MLYTVKYAPKKLEDCIGNKEKIEHIRQWMLQWLSGKKRKPLILWGPPGIGKTSIPYAIKEDAANYRLYVGAYVNRESALALYEQLLAKGITAKVVAR